MIAIPFIGLPLANGLIIKYRLSRLEAIESLAPELVLAGAKPSATHTLSDQEKDAKLAMRPRTVRLTMRGYLYMAGVAVSTAFLLGILFLLLRGLTGPNALTAKYVFAISVDSWTLWSCVSFFRNRIRERRLLTNGELSEGHILDQTKTRYGRQIVYSYPDAGGTGFQNRVTDFSGSLYEEMSVHIFYDPLNPGESAALEGSLYRLG